MPEPPETILETALYAADLDAAERFYGSVIGLARLTRSGNRHVFFKMTRQMLLIFNPAETEKTPMPPLNVPAHGSRGAGHLCFAVSADALDAWSRHLVRHGVDIEAEVTWPNGAKSLYCRDPAGNSIEFATPKLWGFHVTERAG